MPESDFVTHVLDLFEPLGPARARAMMGGHVVFCFDAPVALVADDRLYLKVAPETKYAFARVGGEPFRYQRGSKVVELSYCAPPEEALESAEAMRPWAELALRAAARAERPRRRRPAAKAARRPQTR